MEIQKTINYYLNLPYRMIITPDDEGYGIAIPDLQGCFSHALKWEDIPAMIKDAMVAWIDGALQYNDPIPEPDARFAR